MGCATCGGGSGNIISQTALIDKSNELYHSGNYVIVEYRGATYPHPVGSPTGAIVKDGFYRYAVQTQRGRHLLVHVDDVAFTPELFVPVEVGSEAHTKAAEDFRIDLEYQETQPLDSVPQFDSELNVVEHDTGSDADDKNNEPDEEADEEVRLSRGEAITLSEFTREYGYGHHLQVMADIRTGKLESEKKDGTVYVWHAESSED